VAIRHGQPRNVGTQGHQMRISKLNSTDLFACK